MLNAAFLTLLVYFSICLFGDADEIKSVLVTEGDSVPLYTDITEVQEGDQILWNFGPENTRIAEIIKRDQIGVNINFVLNDGIFKDKLQLDKHTGSLTIRNISTEHTGLYELTVISEKNLLTRFNITVYSTLPIPFISCLCLSSSVQSCSVLCSVAKVSAASLSWYKGNSVLSSISVSDLSISLSLPLGVEYQDNNTYSCVVNNTITNHTTHLDIEQLCKLLREDYHKHTQSISFPLIVLASMWLLVFTSVVYCCSRKCQQAEQKDIKQQIMSEYTQVIFCVQMADLPQTALLDVDRSATAVNYQKTKE